MIDNKAKKLKNTHNAQSGKSKHALLSIVSRFNVHRENHALNAPQGMLRNKTKEFTLKNIHGMPSSIIVIGL